MSSGAIELIFAAGMQSPLDAVASGQPPASASGDTDRPTPGNGGKTTQTVDHLGRSGSSSVLN